MTAKSIDKAKTRIVAWILIGSALAMAGMLAIGVHGIFGMKQLQAIGDELFDHTFAEATAATELRLQLALTRSRMQQIALGSRDADAMRLTTEAGRFVKEAERLGAELAKQSPVVAKPAREIQTLLAEYADFRANIVELVKQGRRDEASLQIAGAGNDIYRHIDVIAAEIVEHARLDAREHVGEAERRADSGFWQAVLLLLVMAAMTAVINALVLRRVTRALDEENARRLVAEADMRASAEHLRAVLDEMERLQRFTQSTLDALNTGICVLDHNGIIIHVNASWRRHAEQRGLRDERGGIGSDYLAIGDATRDGPDHQGHLVAHALRRVLNGADDNFYAEYPCHNAGSRCWMMLSATSFETDGERRVVVAHDDITELRRSQQELARQIDLLQTTLETMHQGILMVDQDLKVITVNRKYFHLMHLPQELYGNRLTLPDLIRYQAQRGDFGPGDIEEQVRIHSRIQEQPTKRRSERSFPDDSVIEIFWNRLPGGQGAVSTYSDISERKRTEAELRRAKEAADAASEAKSTFLATMSHEIRTPMYGILGMAELLEATPLAADQHKMVRTVRDSGSALLAIINDILDFSRIEAGKLSIDAEPLSLHATVTAVVDILAPAAAKKGIDFHTEISAAIPDHLIGDAVRVRQILFNLLGNAIKFTDAVGADGRHGRVTLRALLEPADITSPCVIRFLVEDNGIGMSDEVVARLFQPFSQADSATTRRYGGSGLGLSICVRLVGMMGGEIDVSSHPGESSTFTVRLPFLVLEDELAAVPPAPTFDSGTAPDAMRGVRLLVAEDNEINQELVRRQLARLGYQADIVGNGREALEQLSRHDYALLLTDCHMPLMDGYALAQAVRERERLDPASDGDRHLPIIAFTANILARDVQRCHEAGMDDVVGKPIVLEDLGRAIARWATKTSGTQAGPAIASDQAPPASPTRTIDIGRLDGMIGPDPAMHARILGKFLVSARTLLDEIGAATQEGDTAALAALGHKLKSSARAIGADILADACTALETAGTAGDDAACGAHADAVVGHFAAAAVEIESYLSSNP